MVGSRSRRRSKCGKKHVRFGAMWNMKLVGSLSGSRRGQRLGREHVSRARNPRQERTTRLGTQLGARRQ